MPKSTNPSSLQVGIGQEPFTQANYTLTVGTLSPNNVLVASIRQKHDAGVDFTFMLASHVQDPHAAHPASAISVADVPAGTFTSDNVQGVLQELAGTQPPQPTSIGEWLASSPLTTGIPDWGILGLNTGALTGFDVTTLLGQSHRYPYQWVPPVPSNRTNISQYGPFEPPPASPSGPPVPPVYGEFDQTSGSDFSAAWNAGGFTPRDTVFNVADVTYTGGGNPTALAGGFTRVATGDMVQTYRVLHQSGATTSVPVVVTGMVAPADRGVLALIRWPAGALMPDFLAATATSLTDTLIAAIVLGQGLYGEGACPTDGEPGGLFLLGSTSGDYDPYAWPGRATGQAGLAEIYQGVASCFSGQTFTDASTPAGSGDHYIFLGTSPYWNFDGRVSPALAITGTAQITAFITEATFGVAHTFKIGQPITIAGGNPDLPDGTYTVESVPAPNTVRLWAAGGAGGAAGGTAQRITGCDKDDYPADGIPFPGQVRIGTVAAAGYTPIVEGVPILGAPYLNGAVRGTPATTPPIDLDGNFFQYRLPVLADYSNTPTGLPYTPLLEKPRYYTKPPVADNAAALNQAGNFTDYAQDYYPMQVARFRHRFEIPTPSVFNDVGSYILLHFKKEAYLEDLLVNGVWPTDDRLYSANVVNPSGLTSGLVGLDDVQFSTAQNMIDQTTLSATGWVNGSINGKPFFNLCGSVAVDKTDIVADPPVIAAGPIFRLTTYAAGTIDQWIHTVSGVAYFAAKDDTDTRCVQLDRFALTANQMFDDGVDTRAFLTGNPEGSFDPSRIMTLTPLMMHLGDFFGVTQSYTVAPSLGTTGVWPHAQHIEFAIEAISTAAVGGVGPAIGSVATLPGLVITPTGDATNTFMFSTNGKPHAFLRTPLSHSFTTGTDGVNLANLPIDLLGGDLVLFSGTTRDPAANPQYGNLEDPAAAPVVPPLWPSANTSLFVVQKQFAEALLDEVYRYQSDFNGITGVDNLIGPGLPNPPAPIEIPSKAGVAVVGPAPTLYDWPSASWFQGGTLLNPCYKTSLSNLDTTDGFPQELQVAGLPHRNPPISEGTYAPKTANGMLLYPKTDYTAGHRPSGADGATQYDYTFGVFTRSYVRVLDLIPAMNVLPGTSFALLRFYGLTLEDFAYGGGVTAGSDNMAILVKVPGLTTWMDVGRVDGAGPSKQDPLLDGAGCMVLGPDTKNLSDPAYNYPVAQVKINVGPVANFFKCVADPQCEDEVPLLVKVVYYCPHATAQITVRDFTLITAGSLINLNGTGPAVLTEGVDWAAAVSNDQTAITIATAVNAAAVGVTAQAAGNVVYLMADVFGTAGAAYDVQCTSAAGIDPTLLTNFTGGCDSDKYDLTYQVTSAAGVTPVTFNPAPSEDFKSSEVRGLYTITVYPLT